MGGLCNPPKTVEPQVDALPSLSVAVAIAVVSLHLCFEYNALIGLLFINETKYIYKGPQPIIYFQKQRHSSLNIYTTDIKKIIVDVRSSEAWKERR